MTKLSKIATMVALLNILGTLTGCGIGYNKTLFFTKTNVGLDIDSQPPTAEVSIGRREGVIAPTFESGQTPPVLASFALEVHGFWALLAQVSSTFCGGDAAVTMAKLYDTNDRNARKYDYTSEDFDSAIDLSKEPNYLDWFDKKDKYKNLLGPGEIEPFLFGTDTSFGLKVAWSGMTAQAPDTIRLGFNRKEFALAPMTTIRHDDPNNISVKMPSFLAIIDNSTELGKVTGTRIKHLQYFATGKAADFMARRYGVRKAMIRRLDPVTEKEFREYKVSYRTPDENAEKIMAWVLQDDEKKTRRKKLSEWMRTNTKKVNSNTLDITTWLAAGRYDEYAKAINKLKIEEEQ